MKKVKYIVGFFILTAFLSCNEDDNTLFDQSPRARLQSRIEEYQNVLTSAENGWITSYRPDKDFGYFHLWFQFNKDGTVHTLSDIPLVNNRVGSGIFAPKPGFYKDTTTGYRVSSQNSVDLVFENNMALHYLYSLTIEQKLAGSPKPEFEFYITRATSEEVVLESKTDSGKGGKEKTQMILKRATPEDKESVEKSYAEWERLSNMAITNTYLSDNLEDFININSTNVERRIINKKGERLSIMDMNSDYIKLKKYDDSEVTYSMVMIGDHPMAIIPKGGQLPEVKFAESGKTIDPAKITLEGVDKNTVGVYNATITIGNVKLNKKVVVYDPSIKAQIDLEEKHDLKKYFDNDFKGNKTVTISLVEGTNNIFLATDVAYFNRDFPVYFQVDGDELSVIPQTYVYNDIILVKLTWLNEKQRIITVFIRNQESEREHKDEPDWGYYYYVLLNNE